MKGRQTTMKIEELINVISSGANDTLKNAINEFNEYNIAAKIR